MERMIDAETEELSKREKYRERRGENTLLPLWGRNLRGKYGRGPDTDEAHIGYRTGCRNSVLSQRPDSERDGAGTRDSGPCQRNRIGKRKRGA